ncbi:MULTISPECIES: ABC transporter ATP-binding protein [Atopobiaceae]|nr:MULTISPECIES: ABC transporter ATP-binding protein [Atopobiaceae]
MTNALRVADVQKVYGGKRGSTTRALDGVSFDVDRGEFVAIMGPSGSGKTTLLNCIATIDRPTSGVVSVGGVDVTKMRSRDLAKFRREQLGFVFQDSNLLDTLTCRENVALPLSIARVPVPQIDQRIEAMARALGVSEVLDKFPYQVSGGQKQRVAACRAMVGNPTLVLADEPTGALDSKNSKLLLERFDALNKQLNSTIIMVTHDSFAASYCQRVLFIRDGRIFTELRHGNQSRKEFFSQIMGVVATIGGGMDDAL